LHTAAEIGLYQHLSRFRLVRERQSEALIELGLLRVGLLDDPHQVSQLSHEGADAGTVTLADADEDPVRPSNRRRAGFWFAVDDVVEVSGTETRGLVPSLPGEE
jgi:hypothetical protein